MTKVKLLLSAYSDMNKSEDMSPLGSEMTCLASKPFSANAIMQLVEKGLVDLGARVVDYVPYFRIDDPRYVEWLVAGNNRL